MTIDVIEISPEEMARLSVQQILILRSGQKRKDELTEELEKDIRSASLLLLANGVRRSTVYDEMVEELQREYEKKLGILRDEVTFGVANGTPIPSDGQTPTNAPYDVNYNYSMIQRVQIVQDYYLSIENSSLRMRRYAEDSIAKVYLGDYYTALYSILEQYS